jgi:hypothetical protein
MRSLWLISVFFIFWACSPKLPQASKLSVVSSKEICPVLPTLSGSTSLYSTHVNVIGKHLSGLLLFKSMPDTTKRIIFTSETGVKFFDFEYSKQGFKVLYCIKQLNKKIVINQLRKDLGLIIMDGINPAEQKVYRVGNEFYHEFPTGKDELTYYITDPECKKIVRIENTERQNQKIVVTLISESAGMPDSLNIDHKNFRFNISLKKVERINAFK